jgi:hypothetical protein
MNIIKKLVNLFVDNPTPNFGNVFPDTFNEKLKEFENEALLAKITMLEKAISFLSQKIEIQNEVIRRQNEAIKDIHVTIEEIANFFETIQNVNIVTATSEEDFEDDSDLTVDKKYYN